MHEFVNNMPLIYNIPPWRVHLRSTADLLRLPVGSHSDSGLKKIYIHKIDTIMKNIILLIWFDILIIDQQPKISGVCGVYNKSQIVVFTIKYNIVR